MYGGKAYMGNLCISLSLFCCTPKTTWLHFHGNSKCQKTSLVLSDYDYSFCFYLWLLFILGWCWLVIIFKKLPLLFWLFSSPWSRIRNMWAAWLNTMFCFILIIIHSLCKAKIAFKTCCSIHFPAVHSA